MSEKDMKVWSRMIGKRKDTWNAMPSTELVAIIQPLYSKEASAPVLEDPWKRAEWLLTRYFQQSVDQKLPPDTRREAYEHLNALLRKLDGKDL